VRVILDGKSAPGPEALARLGYPLDHYHLGLVLWRDAADRQGQPDLQHAATKMLDERGASATLMVPHGASALWVWAAWRSESEAPSGFRDHRPAGSRVAIGTPARGLEGFRRTHREAEQLADLARTASGGAGAVLHFADFELAVLLAQNADLAANFIRSHLGPAADDNPTAADLRETVLAYLSHERSLNRAAEALHVARNTVAYRVKKFENLIGRDLKEDRLNIEAALTLADFFGHSVIPEP
jgi:DNA-binding PucR family transcriptional regulator